MGVGPCAALVQTQKGIMREQSNMSYKAERTGGRLFANGLGYCATEWNWVARVGISATYHGACALTKNCWVSFGVCTG